MDSSFKLPDHLIHDIHHLIKKDVNKARPTEPRVSPEDEVLNKVREQIPDLKSGTGTHEINNKISYIKEQLKPGLIPVKTLKKVERLIEKNTKREKEQKETMTKLAFEQQSRVPEVLAAFEKRKAAVVERDRKEDAPEDGASSESSIESMNSSILSSKSTTKSPKSSIESPKSSVESPSSAESEKELGKTPRVVVARPKDAVSKRADITGKKMLGKGEKTKSSRAPARARRDYSYSSYSSYSEDEVTKLARIVKAANEAIESTKSSSSESKGIWAR